MARDLSKRTGLLFILLASAICTVFPTSLFAHVALFPQTTQAGERHASFFIRAPVEKDIPVVELGFAVDEEWIENGGEITFENIPDWQLHVELDAQEHVKKVYWTATEEGASPRTFQMIFMRVNVPDKPGTYPFVSWQKYTDGSVVWWNEPRGPGVTNPYPTVRVEQEPILTAGSLQMSVGGIALLALGMAFYCLLTLKKLLNEKEL